MKSRVKTPGLINSIGSGDPRFFRSGGRDRGYPDHLNDHRDDHRAPLDVPADHDVPRGPCAPISPGEYLLRDAKPAQHILHSFVCVPLHESPLFEIHYLVERRDGCWSKVVRRAELLSDVLKALSD